MSLRPIKGVWVRFSNKEFLEELKFRFQRYQNLKVDEIPNLKIQFIDKKARKAEATMNKIKLYLSYKYNNVPREVKNPIALAKWTSKIMKWTDVEYPYGKWS